MTRGYYVEKKAEDLKIGDMFCHWAQMDDGLYPEAARILFIQTIDKKLHIELADERKLELQPEMIVIVQELA